MAPAPSSRRSILFEAHNLTLGAGTGIATYALELAQAANRIGFESDGLFGVERALARGQDELNEILAFDAVGENEGQSPMATAWRNVRYPFNAIWGLRPIELSRSGLVVGSVGEALQTFHKVLAATRLVDISTMHFRLYGKKASIKPPTKPDIFHATHPVPLTVKGVPNLYTIHDLVPLRLPYTTLDDKKYFFRLLTSIAHTADHIVTVSEYSKRDIIQHLKVNESRVTNTYQTVVIPPSVTSRSNDEVAEELARLYGLDFSGYFLFYGAIEPKKNVGRIVDAYAASGSDLPLVVVGGLGWQNRVERRKLRDPRFTSFRIDGNVVRQQTRVRRLDYLPRSQLFSLIRGAKALLFPSIYEGFGLPVIEAMSLGTPVITSSVASLPEIAGDAAILIDPYSVDDLARAIRTIEADADLREELMERGRSQAKKFSPKNYDQRLEQMYNHL